MQNNMNEYIQEDKIKDLLSREIDVLEGAISDENHVFYQFYNRGVEDGLKSTQDENYGNPTYYETIVSSDIWKEWTKYAEENMLFDMAESIECGWLSDKHWEAFINWVKTNENKNTTS